MRRLLHHLGRMVLVFLLIPFLLILLISILWSITTAFWGAGGLYAHVLVTWLKTPLPPTPINLGSVPPDRAHHRPTPFV